MTYDDLTEVLATTFRVKRELMSPGTTFADIGLESLALAELSAIIGVRTARDVKLHPTMAISTATADSEPELVTEPRRNAPSSCP
ncbi:acyl carrier protein [Streptomyces sp. URMC 124]|uniref:acyl carrier protein n=1 Tax=Streptomyces sp. URMC 124 TaxID=3423405 RepID=UPI003F1CA930